MAVTAIITGTFDPVHKGHLLIISRAAAVFQKVVVAVADSHYKNELFSVEVRTAAVKAAVGRMQNVEVAVCEGLVADFCEKYESPLIVRGARNGSDFEYELGLSKINSEISSAVTAAGGRLDTVVFPADPVIANTLGFQRFKEIFAKYRKYLAPTKYNFRFIFATALIYLLYHLFNFTNQLF